ncbi:MAG: PAS domain-containing sensor histidine kinase [Lewinella sp.]|nr:PAS domain-containing sensor histidine kinase [Lewinella sp.]
MVKADAELRLQAVIDTAIDGIITIDEQGIVETLNPAAAELFGFDAQDVIGHNIKMLMPSPYFEEHDFYIRRYLDSGKPHIIGIGREVEGKRKDGTVFPLRLAISEVFLEGKRIFTGIIHDLSDVNSAKEKILRLNRELEEQNAELDRKVHERTEKLAKVVDQLLATNKKLGKEIHDRQAVEEALRLSEKELKETLDKEKELSQLKSRFVSMASHEFRTPLSTILSSIELVELLEKPDQKDKRVKHIDRIKNAVSHLTSILTDFLSLSRLEEGRIQFQPQHLNIRDFCLDVVDELKNHLKTDQKLNYTGQNDDQDAFLDKNVLRHILSNLLINASKYSGEGSLIDFKLKITQGKIYIAVQDEGIGIPKEDQKHLFTRFFRANNVENIKGTGLGLHIVKRYLDLMKGEIEFKSPAPGMDKGTIFTVFIPINQDL